MKRKMILPLLAVVFALASAFVSAKPSPLAQQGWYDSNGLTVGGGMEGNITTPPGNSPVCSVSATSHLCKIQVSSTQYNAFDSQANAESGGGAGTDGRLKYD